MLTIGGLAAHAGVTVRTVRHYHAKGLLPEPERDHSGYRVYGAEAVVELIRIRTLTAAGVPLARVRALLDAGPEEFAAAVAEIDHRLCEEIRVRERHRERIAGLVAGDGLALPVEVTGLLERLRALGVDERIVRIEHDGWILLAAHSPEQAAAWAADKRDQLGEGPLIECYRGLGEALDLADDDPRLAGLADRLAVCIERLGAGQARNLIGEGFEPPLARLLDSLTFDSAPAARRLIGLLRKRSWADRPRIDDDDRLGPPTR
ncbi:MerR family transcriptional regulator [Glycomyces scopariae]